MTFPLEATEEQQLKAFLNSDSEEEAALVLAYNLLDTNLDPTKSQGEYTAVTERG